MKFTLTRATLKEALAGLSRVTPRKTHLPILAAVQIEAKDGRVRLSATNLDQYATFTAECGVQKPGTSVVEMEKLKPFTKGADSDLLTLESTKDHLHIQNPVHGQPINHTLPTHDQADWPACPPKVETSEVPAEFLDALHRVTPFASTDASRAVLCGVCVDASDPKHPTLVATDGRRLTAVEVPPLPIRERVILQASRFLDWNRITGVCRIGTLTTKHASWFKLELGGWEGWFKVVEGDYPKWRHVIPGGDLHHTFEIAEADVVFIQKMMPSFPGHEDANSSVQLVGANSKVYLSGRDREATAASTALLTESKFSGKDAQVAVNRSYLMESFAAGFRTFGMSDELSPLVARDGKSGIHVLMPMRIDAAVPVPKPETAPAPEPVKETPRVATQVATPVVQSEPVKEKTMPEKTSEPNALDRLLAAYEATKAKVKEANEAIAVLASVIKEAVREDRVRRSEIDTVRAGLERLKAIRV